VNDDLVVVNLDLCPFELASAYVVMQRGEIVLSGRQSDMDETAVRTYLTV
jgi:ABC-type branched-subunit amino acid transport system ATPase component